MIENKDNAYIWNNILLDWGFDSGNSWLGIWLWQLLIGDLILATLDWRFDSGNSWLAIWLWQLLIGDFILATLDWALGFDSGNSW